ncbi:MAG: L-threonylcarbamoyladenylate synthase, partial [Pseudomonadota bacterium]
HIASATQLEQLAISVPSLAYRVADAFWPGPLTLILSRAPSVPNEIAEGMATVAVRMPAHPVAKKLLQAAETPIGAPSANRFTHPSATTANHVLEDLDGRIDLILDGGPSTIGIESTVIDLTTEPRVLRPGGISLRELKSVIPGIETRVSFVGDQGVSVSPGQMLKHYSPKAKLTLFKGVRERVLERLLKESRTAQSKGTKVGVLALDTDTLDFPEAVHVERLPDDAELSGVSSALFASMRRLDAEGCDVILARDFGRAGLGEAVWDRLLRAAEGQVINVD